jgi:hypothetical protein
MDSRIHPFSVVATHRSSRESQSVDLSGAGFVHQRRVAQLKTAIREFIAAHHAKAIPFSWTKSADEILASIARFAQRTLDFQAAPLIQRTMRSGH